MIIKKVFFLERVWHALKYEYSVFLPHNTCNTKYIKKKNEFPSYKIKCIVCYTRG